MHLQFEGKDLDTVKAEYDAEMDGLIGELDEALKVVRTGRASANIFDHLEVTAYG